MVAELDVTLTDYALAMEGAVFAVWMLRIPAPTPSLANTFSLFFASISAAALVGGTVHGFFPDNNSTGARVLWVSTLVLLGITAFILWRLGGLLLLPPRGVKWLTALAAIGFLAYCVLIGRGRRDFALALGNYLPAAVFFLLGLGRRYYRGRDRSALVGIIGLLLTFAAAAVQHFRISIHAYYFDHNAFYHLIQGIALLLIFSAARSLVQAKELSS